jgi:signal transduction histidine kinase
MVARGALEPQPRAIDAAALARHVAQAFRAAAEERGVKLEVEVPDALPSIQGDPALLEQALNELLHNAARHTPPGGRITMTADRGDGQLCIHVCDTGAGIPQELLPHVFDLFVRGDAAPSGWDRLGVGLALVRQIAAKHRGQVEAHSAGPGQGSEFILRLPWFNP